MPALDNKYCYSCGKELPEDKICENKCFSGHPQNECDHLEKRFERAIRDGGWQTRFHGNRHYAPLQRFMICHPCKYFMYHTLNWCPNCGGKFHQAKLTYKECLEKYPDYREGY